MCEDFYELCCEMIPQSSAQWIVAYKDGQPGIQTRVSL